MFYQAKILCQKAIFPPLLALALLWSGSWCGTALLESRGGPKAKEMILYTTEEIRSANQVFFEKKTYQILYDYAVAFLDSAIAFDFVPEFHAASLWGLILHLPQGVQITHIQFSQHAMHLSVSAESPQQLVSLMEYLQNCEQYADVSFSPDPDASHAYAGDLTLTFR